VVRTDGTVLGTIKVSGKSTGSPAWSPDAAKIAFTTQAGWGQVHLAVANADGSGAHELPAGRLGGTFPTWSPDGTRIAYTSYWYPPSTYPPGHIFVIGADGSGQRQVTNGPDYDLRPQWAPDGQTILFVRRPDRFNSPKGDVYSVRPDGSALTQVTSMGNVSGFALSPDGTQLAVADGEAHRIVLLPFGANGPSRTLIDTDYLWRAVVISWSPDGKALALGTGDYDVHTYKGDKVVVVNADGSGLSAIPNSTGGEPAWRPQ
jgi:TolB protein